MIRAKDIKDKQGFTIIEVVLVLAIAGLIFLMVFIALPQLQRAQRDTQRRSDMARAATAVTQYQTNNNGKVPMATGADADTFITNYLGGADGFTDPDGTPYTIKFGTFVSGGSQPSWGITAASGEAGSAGYVPASDTTHTVFMYNKAKCKGEEVELSSNSNDYAILYKLEGSGVYCQDNQ